jgi:dynein regulatory complex subunit 2
MAHTEHLERLMKLQDQRLLLIERQFEADLKVLADEYDDERDEIIAKHKDEMAELEAIHKMIEEEEKQEEDTVNLKAF